jgi:chromosomal replication initiation ATPase DnaA
MSAVLSIWRGEFRPTRRPKFEPGAEARKIVERVAAEEGVTAEALFGPGRCRKIAWPRQRAYAELYVTGRYSLPAIGRFMGGRDHTGVHYGIRAYRQRMANP